MPTPEELPELCGVLGPLRVLRGGEALDLGPPKQRAVLGALLLARGGVVSVDRLLASVWGDDPPARALASLQAYVSNLRRVLAGTARRELRAPGYALVVDGAAVDVVLFRDRLVAARAAAATRGWHAAAAAAAGAEELWRGPLLADLGDLAQQEWVAPEAARLARERAEAGELLVRALLGLGRTGEALVAAERLVGEQPLADGPRWLLVLALHRSGRTAEALDVHREHAKVLADELGIDPGPELRQLQVQLLSQDPALEGWPGPATDAPTDPPPVTTPAVAEAGPAAPVATRRAS